MPNAAGPWSCDFPEGLYIYRWNDGTTEVMIGERSVGPPTRETIESLLRMVRWAWAETQRKWEEEYGAVAAGGTLLEVAND
jgi:hypothetical protein